MSFDIARQPFIPAMMTCLALAIIEMYVSPEGADTATLTAVGQDLAKDGSMMLEMPRPYLAHFEALHPSWAHFLNILLLITTGTAIGRITTRYNLFKVNTCISLPLFMMGALILGVEGVSLTAYCGTALMALSLKNFARTFRSGYTFDAVFRSTLYLGALVLLMPETAPLLMIFPLGCFVFRRTLREVVTGMAGLMLLPLLLAYINWGLGGEFTAPFVAVYEAFLSGVPLAIFHTLEPPMMVMSGLLVLVTLFGIQFFLSDIYAVGTKPRFILIFDIFVLLISIGMLFTPSASMASWMLIAVPMSIIMPCFLIRISQTLSSSIYFMLMAMAVARIILQ